MSGGILAYGLLAALAIALLAAAATDLRARIIEHWTVIAIAAGAPLFWWASGLALWPGVAIQLGLAAAVFAVVLVLWMAGLMGGGDLKLLVALALWLTPSVYAKFLFMMAVIGGAMSVYAGARNMALPAAAAGRKAIAWLAVALWIGVSVYIARVLSGAPPADFAAAAAATAPALIYGGLAAVFAVMLAGSLVISRSQKERAQVPYGLAISTAGLWILANTYAWPAFAAVHT